MSATATAPRAATLNDEACWRAVVERRPTAERLFVVGVRTTGVYCRPTCRVKQPKRQNVVFLRNARDAEAAGFRACKRCRPADQLTPEHTLVRDICRRLDSSETVPTLDELSKDFGMSKFHLQRTFKRAVGISPREYADARRVERAKKALRNGDAVADAVYGAGYGSGSRLYERSDAVLGMTPGSYRRKGEGMSIMYTIVTTAFGRMLVGATERGVSAITFGDADAPLERHLHHEYSGAAINRDDAAMRSWIERVLAVVEGSESCETLPLDIRATAFRLRVWRELQRIPRGQVRSYAEIARAIGEPKAARAVGNACGANPIALVVPCHRVVANDGTLGGYALGLDRKERILAFEGAAPRPRSRRPKARRE